jgi:hypothetical protein
LQHEKTYTPLPSQPPLYRGEDEILRTLRVLEDDNEACTYDV